MAKARKAISLGVAALIVIVLILIVGFGVFINATFDTTRTTTTTNVGTRATSFNTTGITTSPTSASTFANSSSSSSFATLSITAKINGSTVQNYGSALMVTVTVLNNGSATINIPPLYRIVQDVVVVNSAGASIGGSPTVPSSQTGSSEQTMSLNASSSLIAYFTIVFLSAENPVAPNVPVSVFSPTSINAYGAAYLQGIQSYTIKVNAFYPNGEAVPLTFPLIDELATSNTSTATTTTLSMVCTPAITQNLTSTTEVTTLCRVQSSSSANSTSSG